MPTPPLSTVKNTFRGIDAADLWAAIRKEALAEIAAEPMLTGFLEATVVHLQDLAAALTYVLAHKLDSALVDVATVETIFATVYRQYPQLVAAAGKDILAYYDRDPACELLSTPLLFFKGFHAIQTHRINHALWRQNKKTLALFIQNRASEVFGMDIHPAAVIGTGIMSDHGTGVVIGETAVLGNDISLLHGVTLGGTGKSTGDRHPKIKDGVMIGANSSILGNITIGECARVGAGSVVTQDVPPHVTVVGVPAKIVGTTENIPALEMDQILAYDDYII